MSCVLFLLIIIFILQNLPPIEKEKRRLRRLRNKEAAAKCRERRLNHTSSLLQVRINLPACNSLI